MSETPAFINNYDKNYVTLSNGVQMPIVGYGVFQIPPEETVRCVCDALEVGYRSIDTAQAYFNEEAVGKGIKQSGVPRKDIFLTTKVWISKYKNARQSVLDSMQKLQVDYLDLVLLHQPFNDYYSAWRDLEGLYKEGKIRSIGVSNFFPDRLVDLCTYAEIKPMVNQVETHPYFQQENAHQWMLKEKVQQESWGPLSEGRVQKLLNEPVLLEIAKAHNKTPAQIALRFTVQRSIVVIPKSVNKGRMAENLNIFDFTLTTEEMDKIRQLDEGESKIVDHHNPEMISMLAKYNF